MKKLTGLAALTLALCLAALGAFAQTGHANEAIRIGLMGPMTGSWASEGQEMKQVVELLAGKYLSKSELQAYYFYDFTVLHDLLKNL